MISCDAALRVFCVELIERRNPAVVKNAYTDDSIWRNRDTFLRGHEEIVAFLTKKWEKENGYRLRKELFAFTDHKVCPTWRCSVF